MKTDRAFGKLLLISGSMTFLWLAGLFGGWMISFAVMNVFSINFLVGMNYLVWPIVFPLFSVLPIFILLSILIPLFPGGYLNVFKNKTFLVVVTTLMLLSLLIMFVTCPLDIGGTLLTQGLNAFGPSY